MIGARRRPRPVADRNHRSGRRAAAAGLPALAALVATAVVTLAVAVAWAPAAGASVVTPTAGPPSATPVSGAVTAACQQTVDAATPPLNLVSQSALVDANGTFDMRIDLGALAGAPLYVAVSVFSVLDDETGLVRQPSRPLNKLPVRPLAEVPVDSTGVMTLDLPIRSGDPFDTLSRVRIPDPGVYPVQVSLCNATGVVASIRLDLIRLPQPGVDPARATAPRPLSAVLGVGGPDGLSVAEATRLLKQHSDLAVTLLLGPGLVVDLAANSSQARNLATAANGRPVVATVDPNLDPSALSTIGQTSLYFEAVESTRAELSDLGFTPSTSVLPITAPLTAAGADVVAATGATVALDLSEVSADAPAFTPGTIVTSTGPLAVVRLDPGTAPVAASAARNAGGAPSAAAAATGSTVSAAAEPRGSLAAAHRQLARLTFRSPRAVPLLLGGLGSLEGPSTRPMANVDPAFLDLLLDVVTQHPAAATGGTATGGPAAGGTSAGSTSAGGSSPGPFTLLTLDAAAPAVAVQEQSPAEAPVQDLAPVAERIRGIQDLLGTYDSFYASGSSSPASLRSQVVNALSLDRTDAARAKTLDNIALELSNGLTAISLPSNQTVTMAARRVPIPITIDNTAQGDRRVLLRFRSDKLVVTEQGTVITLQPDTNSINVEVESRSLGESPLEVSLYTPDGRHLLSTSRYRVRSTAVPGVGLAITIAGLIGLGIWWFLSIKRRRAGGGPATDATDDGGGGPPPDTGAPEPPAPEPVGEPARDPEPVAGLTRDPAPVAAPTREPAPEPEPAPVGARADRPVVVATGSVEP